MNTALRAKLTTLTRTKGGVVTILLLLGWMASRLYVAEVAIPGLVDRGVEEFSERNHLEVSGDWQVSLGDREITATDLIVRSKEDAGREPLLSVRRLHIEWRMNYGLLARVTSLGPLLDIARGRPVRVRIHEVEMAAPRINVLRRHSGEWNWDFLGDELPEWSQRLVGRIEGTQVTAEDLRLAWSEELRHGDQGNFMEGTSTTYLDQAELTVHSAGSADPSLKFTVNGRLGEGTVEGRGSLWARRASETVELSLHLANVHAGILWLQAGDFTPEADGRFTGQLDLGSSERPPGLQLDIKADCRRCGDGRQRSRDLHVAASLQIPPGTSPLAVTAAKVAVSRSMRLEQPVSMVASGQPELLEVALVADAGADLSSEGSLAQLVQDGATSWAEAKSEELFDRHTEGHLGPVGAEVGSLAAEKTGGRVGRWWKNRREKHQAKKAQRDRDGSPP